MTDIKINREIRHRPHEHKTSTGLTLRLKAVPEWIVARYAIMAEDEMRREGEPIDPPMYEVPLGDPEFYKARGEAQPAEEFEHAYDPANGIDTLTVPGDAATTARNFAAWRAHRAALHKLESIQAERRQLATIVFGVMVEGGMPEPESPEWAELEQTLDLLDLEMPLKPQEQQAFWLMYGGHLDASAMQIITTKVQVLNAASAADPAEIESFLRSVSAEVAGYTSQLLAEATANFRTALADTDGQAGAGDGEGVGI